MKKRTKVKEYKRKVGYKLVKVREHDREDDHQDKSGIPRTIGVIGGITALGLGAFFLAKRTNASKPWNTVSKGESKIVSVGKPAGQPGKPPSTPISQPLINLEPLEKPVIPHEKPPIAKQKTKTKKDTSSQSESTVVSPESGKEVKPARTKRTVKLKSVETKDKVYPGNANKSFRTSGKKIKEYGSRIQTNVDDRLLAYNPRKLNRGTEEEIAKRYEKLSETEKPIIGVSKADDLNPTAHLGTVSKSKARQARQARLNPNQALREIISKEEISARISKKLSRSQSLEDVVDNLSRQQSKKQVGVFPTIDNTKPTYSYKTKTTKTESTSPSVVRSRIPESSNIGQNRLAQNQKRQNSRRSQNLSAGNDLLNNRQTPATTNRYSEVRREQIKEQKRLAFEEERASIYQTLTPYKPVQKSKIRKLKSKKANSFAKRFNPVYSGESITQAVMTPKNPPIHLGEITGTPQQVFPTIDGRKPIYPNRKIGTKKQISPTIQIEEKPYIPTSINFPSQQGQEIAPGINQRITDRLNSQLFQSKKEIKTKQNRVIRDKNGVVVISDPNIIRSTSRSETSLSRRNDAEKIKQKYQEKAQNDKNKIDIKRRETRNKSSLLKVVQVKVNPTVENPAKIKTALIRADNLDTWGKKVEIPEGRRQVVNNVGKPKTQKKADQKLIERIRQKPLYDHTGELPLAPYPKTANPNPGWGKRKTQRETNINAFQKQLKNTDDLEALSRNQNNPYIDLNSDKVLPSQFQFLLDGKTPDKETTKLIFETTAKVLDDIHPVYTATPPTTLKIRVLDSKNKGFKGRVYVQEDGIIVKDIGYPGTKVVDRLLMTKIALSSSLTQSERLYINLYHMAERSNMSMSGYPNLFASADNNHWAYSLTNEFMEKMGFNYILDTKTALTSNEAFSQLLSDYYVRELKRKSQIPLSNLVKPAFMGSYDINNLVTTPQGKVKVVINNNSPFTPKPDITNTKTIEAINGIPQYAGKVKPKTVEEEVYYNNLLDRIGRFIQAENMRTYTNYDYNKLAMFLEKAPNIFRF